MLTKYKWLIATAALIGAAWFIFSPRIELQSQRADRAEQDLEDARAQIEVQARVLVGHQQLLGELSAIRASMTAIGQTINQNQRDQSAALEELIHNDKTVAEYLGLPVPDDLGLLYARPETTDPTAYRSNSSVRPGAVLPTGAAADP